MIGWIILLWIIVIFLVSAIPLNLAVHVLGGQTNIIKTAFIALIAGIVVGLIRAFWSSTIGAIVAFVVMIWIYREAFRLMWLKAFLAWILQFIFLALFFFALTLLGLGLLL